MIKVYRGNPFYIDSIITLPDSAVNENPTSTLVGADIQVWVSAPQALPGVYLAQFTRSAQQVKVVSEVKNQLNCVVLVPPYVTENLPNVGQLINYGLRVTPINKYPVSYQGSVAILPSNF